MHWVVRTLVLSLPTLGVAAVPMTAHAAVVISKAELQSGQLRVEGSGVLPDHQVTVSPGSVVGTSDANGAFKIQASPYSSPTCKVTVSDGSTSASATLNGCTPSSTTSTTSTSTTSTSMAAPAVTLQPSSLTFPSEPTGQASPPQTVSVANTGTASLFVNGLSHTGTAATDFTVTQDMCSGVTVAAGASCTLTITFTPTADGARTASLGVTDNAPASPQVIGLTGTGAGTATGPTPLSIYTGTLTCTSAGCDLGGGGSKFVHNFYAAVLQAQGGTAPYTFSASTALPTGLTLTSAGLLSGTLAATGSFSFAVTVQDSAGASSTTQFTLTVSPTPGPSPSGCQKGSNVRESLTGSAIAGKTPTGQAQEDESNLTACGGYGILTAQVSGVNLANGTVLWVYLDSQAVGTISLNNGSGSIQPYNLGNVGLRFDHVDVVNGPPTAPGAKVLTGGSFA
jgi:hypothetical protein